MASNASWNTSTETSEKREIHYLCWTEVLLIFAVLVNRVSQIGFVTHSFQAESPFYPLCTGARLSAQGDECLAGAVVWIQGLDASSTSANKNTNTKHRNLSANVEKFTQNYF